MKAVRKAAKKKSGVQIQQYAWCGHISGVDAVLRRSARKLIRMSNEKYAPHVSVVQG